MARAIKENGKAILFAIIFLASYMFYVIYFSDSESNTYELVSSNDIIGPVQSEIIYSQDIYIDQNNLKALSFQFGTYQRVNNGVIIANLIGKEGLISTWTVNMNSLEDNQYYTFFLDKCIKNSAGRNYIMQFNFKLEENDIITIYCGDSQGKSAYCIQDEQFTGKALAHKVLYKKNIWGINSVYGCIMILLVIVLIILLKYKKVCDENLFILTFIPICILYLLCNAPFNVPDEKAHFCRAFEISEGHMISEEYNGGIGRELPFKNIDLLQYKNSWRSVAKDWNLKLSEEKEFIPFWNTAVYAPVSYASQALGIFVARLVCNNLWFIYYAGRLFNIMFITILFFYSIKMSPMGKEMIYLIAMIPMNIHQVVSYSPDAMLLAIICFIVSLVFYLRYTYKETLTFRHYLLIYFLVVCVSLYKVIYLPICLTFLLIPSERFGSKKKFIIHGTVAAMLALCMALGWLAIAGGFVIPPDSVDLGMQLKYIMHNPFEYYMIIARTIFESSELWIMNMLGSSLGWMDIPVSGGIMLCYLGMLIYTITAQSEEENIKTCFPQIICAIEIVLQCCLLLTTEYLSWTPVRNETIWGVQGRYLLPMLIYVYYMRSKNYNKRSRIIGSETKFSIILLVITINVCACFSCLIKCTS